MVYCTFTFADSDVSQIADSETSVNVVDFYKSDDGGYWINPSFDDIDGSDLNYASSDKSDVYSYSSDTVYSYIQAADVIREYMVNREPEFSVKISIQIPNWNNFFDTLVCKYTGNPREGDSLWVTCQTLTYVCTQINDDCYEYSFSVVYNTTAEQEEELYSLAEQLLIDLNIKSKTSDYAKFYVVYQWIVDNVYYDFYHLDLVESDLSQKLDYSWLWSAWAAIATRGTICDGYAQLLYYLLTMCDVPCRYINGSTQTGAHAWNIVEINGMWYYCDPTNDANNYTWLSPDYYSYCLRGEGNFPNHTPGARYSTEEFLSEHPISASDYGSALKMYVDDDEMMQDPCFEHNIMASISSTAYANDIFARCYQDRSEKGNIYVRTVNPNATETNIKSYLNEQISKENIKALTVAVLDSDDSIMSCSDSSVSVTTSGIVSDKYWPDAHTSDLIGALDGLVFLVPDGNYDWDKLCRMCDVVICPYECDQDSIDSAAQYETEVIEFFGHDPRNYIYYCFQDFNSPISVSEAFALFYANPTYKYWNGDSSSRYDDAGEPVRSNMCQLNTMECDNNVILVPYYQVWLNPETGDECSHVYADIDFHWAPDGMACGASVTCDLCGYEKTRAVNQDFISVAEDVAPTCTKDGYIYATATSKLSYFDFNLSDGDITDTYFHYVFATGHTEPVIKDFNIRQKFIFAGDYYCDAAVIGCQLCDKVDFVVTDISSGAKISLVETGRKEATCTEGGYVDFYLVVKYGTTMYAKNDVKLVLDAGEHNWGDPQYNWSDNYSECIVSMTCINCNLYTEALCEVERECVIEPTIYSNGLDIVQATAKLNDIVCNDSRNVITQRVDVFSKILSD